VIWRHQVSGALRVWYLDGVTRTDTGVLDGIEDPEFAVVGTGDVNGDGLPELLLRNGATGANVVLPLVGEVTAASAPMGRQYGPSWAVVGTGDYDGDGVLDLLWRQVVTGALRVGSVNGSTLGGTRVADGGVLPFTWTVAGNGSSAPSAPTGLMATATGSSITLSWAAPTAGGVPTGYVIEAGAAAGFADLAAISTDSTATTFTVSGVATGRYTLRVRATNGAGSSGASDEVSLEVGAATAGVGPGRRQH
jgi:hypothetical protein